MVLIDDLYNKSNGEIHYPPPLMELWMQSTRPPHDIPSGELRYKMLLRLISRVKTLKEFIPYLKAERTSQPPPPVPSISSPPEQFHYEVQLGNVSHSIAM